MPPECVGSPSQIVLTHSESHSCSPAISEYISTNSAVSRLLLRKNHYQTQRQLLRLSDSPSPLGTARPWTAYKSQWGMEAGEQFTSRSRTGNKPNQTKTIMNRWLNRVAVVTGASSGIGAAVCRDLVSKGLVVVGLARREERLQELKASLPAEQAKRFHPRKCDVGQEKEVIAAFAWVDSELGGADVLVNNAGIVRPNVGISSEGNSDALRAILDTNVLGVSWCTREAFQSLLRRKVNDGHVVIINSVVGHGVPVMPGMTMGMYPPSKHAVTALTEVLRQEFLNSKTQTKITSISPGAVSTELVTKETLDAFPDLPLLSSEDVADAVSYVIQTPPNVQIHELTIKPVGEAF